MPCLLLLLFTLLLAPLGAQPSSRDAVGGDEGPTLPHRGWWHQLGASLGWARDGNNDFGTATSHGIGADYHHLRQYGSFVAGAGVGFAVTNAERQERLASLTALAEYQVGQGTLRPLLRISGGVALPVGSRELAITSRKAGPVLHPAIGLLVLPPRGQWGAIVADLGYRFSRVAFSAPDFRGGSFEREVTYRRLTLGISSRF